MFGRKKPADDPNGTLQDRTSSDHTLTNDFQPTKQQLKRATRTRKIWALIASFFLLISVVFLILVEVGDTAPTSVRSKIYFIQLDLANIIPTTVPNSILINSIAQTLGLHDYYTVGLWGFCQGNQGVGITQCSTPQTLYWFNPVEILQSQLLAGATIALPAEVTNILGLIMTVSHWMFGLFLAGACLSFLMIFLIPLAIYSRWWSLPITILTFLAALFTTVAAVIATVLFIIMQNAVTSVTQLNIGANIGVEMFAFMWIASGSAILAWLIVWGQCCCCASRRDVKRGKKRGSKKAWVDGDAGAAPPMSEKAEKQRRGFFGRSRKAEQEAGVGDV